MIVKLFYSLVFIGAGVFIMYNRKGVKEWTGNIAFAEKYIGRGSSYFIILLMGVGFIYLGIAYLFGWIQIFPPSE